MIESSESKKKGAGGISLFEGIDVVGSKQTKLLDAANDVDGFLSRDSPPPTVKKEDKATRNTFSLFDDNEEDESDWNKPIFTSSKANAKDTLKVCEDFFRLFALVWSLHCLSGCVMFSTHSTQPADEQPQAKSTGVFQDEELLFSQTQQKDNDPDVDLFATSGKASVSRFNICIHLSSLSAVESKQVRCCLHSRSPRSV